MSTFCASDISSAVVLFLATRIPFSGWLCHLPSRVHGPLVSHSSNFKLKQALHMHASHCLAMPPSLSPVGQNANQPAFRPFHVPTFSKSRLYAETSIIGNNTNLRLDVNGFCFFKAVWLDWVDRYSLQNSKYSAAFFMSTPNQTARETLLFTHAPAASCMPLPWQDWKKYQRGLNWKLNIFQNLVRNHNGREHLNWLLQPTVHWNN